jgi:hypothetical protein
MSVSPLASSKEPEKKTYSRPQLKVYGTIVDITLASTANGAMWDFRGDFMVDMRTH